MSNHQHVHTHVLICIHAFAHTHTHTHMGTYTHTPHTHMNAAHSKTTHTLADIINTYGLHPHLCNMPTHKYRCM